MALGQWAIEQRDNFKRGRLTSNQIARLEALPGWAWNVTDALWEQNYADLRHHLDRHANTYPRANSRSRSGIDLAEWVRRQRAAPDTLNTERRRRLEQLPGWSWKKVPRRPWDEAYRELVAYTHEHGTASPLQGTVTPSGLPLGHWVSAQRVAYNRGTMARKFPERIERLESLPGWVWSVADALWENGFAELAAVAEATGSAAPGKSVISPSGFRLGQWVQDQRRKHRRGQLSPERAARLERLPGWYWEHRRR